MPLRRANDDALTLEIEKALASLTVQAASEIMDRLNIPNAPINTVKDVAENEYMRAAFMRTIDMGEPGEFLVSEPPFKLEKYAPHLKRNPPGLGEHTDEIMAELGYSPETVAAYREQGIFDKG